MGQPEWDSISDIGSIVSKQMGSSKRKGQFATDPSSLDDIQERIVSFVEETVTEADKRGVVIGLSGGVDSTVTAMLAVEALGADRVLGLSLPCAKTDSYHARDVRTIADGLGIELRRINVRPLLGVFEDLVAPAIDPEPDRRARGNAIARLRMLCLYYAANVQSRLVLGTANRSERMLGYFTKYGDGAADCYPLGDLYKTEVWALAEHVGVPKRIIAKAPTPGLQAGVTDERELGADYGAIDSLLVRITNGDPVADVVDELEIDRETAERIANRCERCAHKREVPPTPGR